MSATAATEEVVPPGPGLQAAPILTRLVLEKKGLYLQSLSLPGNCVWIWIGEGAGSCTDLALALGNRNDLKSVSSTSILKGPPSNEESARQFQTLAEKLSRKLGGKPVYLSSGISYEILEMEGVEAKLVAAIKDHPQAF